MQGAGRFIRIRHQPAIYIEGELLWIDEYLRYRPLLTRHREHVPFLAGDLEDRALGGTVLGGIEVVLVLHLGGLHHRVGAGGAEGVEALAGDQGKGSVLEDPEPNALSHDEVDELVQRASVLGNQLRIGILPRWEEAGLPHCTAEDRVASVVSRRRSHYCFSKSREKK